MHRDRGFTLLQLILVLFILGGLAAIALPSFLGCGNKARQSEAKTYVGSINRAQQAYFAKKKVFSKSVKDLDIGISTQTVNYDYSIHTIGKAAYSYGIVRKGAKQPLRSYVGAVFLVPAKGVKPTAKKDEAIAQAIICESNSPGADKPSEPINQDGKIACGSDTREIGRSDDPTLHVSTSN